jgi:hypothetical protein
MSIQEAIVKSGLTVRLFADCWDGSVAGHAEEPATGTEWKVVPGTRTEAGRYYQEVRMTEVNPNHPILLNLPENCYIDGGF